MVRRLSVVLSASVLAWGLSSAPARAGASSPTLIGIVAGVTALWGIAFDVDQPDREVGHLIAGLGGFDVIDNENEAVEYRLEFRPAWQLWRIKPIVGVFGTTDEGTGGYLGIGHDLNIGKRIVIHVNTAATLFAAGEGKHLGSYAVLRSGVELGYRFDNAARLALTFHHMSHGEIFDDKNPGTEMVALTFALPLESLFGK